jgi:hypothetical protein
MGFSREKTAAELGMAILLSCSSGGARRCQDSDFPGMGKYSLAKSIDILNI